MTNIVLVLLLAGQNDALVAMAHKDYEGCEGNRDKRSEGASRHCLAETYEAPQQQKAIAEQHVALRHVDTVYSQIPTHLTLDPDSRVYQIQMFMKDRPAAKHAELFVQVADTNGLDWRLLPTLAYLESSGGKYHLGNNIFGWASGNKHFRSVEEGIRFVGDALGNGRYYKGKSTLGKIKTYNVYKHYHVIAMATMDRISKIPLDPSVETLQKPQKASKPRPTRKSGMKASTPQTKSVQATKKPVRAVLVRVMMSADLIYGDKLTDRRLSV